MAFDWDQFFRGLAGGGASGLALGRQARALNVEEQKGALALETARGEIADFKTFSDYSRELNAGIESEGQRLGSSQTANELSGKLVSDLALDEPGSPERKLAVGALPKQTDPLVRTYLVSASGKSLHNLHQASIEDDDFGVEQFRRVLTHPGAAAEAVTRARAAVEAREADPVGYGFQIQMKLLGRKAEKLTAARDRGWQVYSQMRPGSKAQAAMETLITGIDRQLSALETQRNNLSSPQFSTFAQGAEEVTQLVDPQTGELLPVGRAERPVYIQQRGQAARAAVAAGQREAQFQQKEVRLGGQFERDIGIQERGVSTALRKEFNALPEVKNYKEVVPIVVSVREAMQVDTAAADMNLIFGAAKVMDPQSVTRPSETEMVIDAGSPAEKFKGQFNYILGGGRLTAAARTQLLNEIESRARGHEQLYENAVQQYQSGAPAIGALPRLGAVRDRSARIQALEAHLLGQ